MMKKYLSLCRCMKKSFAHIHLVDKFLCLFMLILLIQSACNLFFPVSSPDISSIDVIVRTSTAAIFGYFLSANFIRRPSAEDADTPPPPQLHITAMDKYSEESERETAAEKQRKYDDNQTTQRLQIIAAAFIGLFCLISLLILRNILAWSVQPAVSSSAVATITQFRDFISGCIGFLIGCPNTLARKPEK